MKINDRVIRLVDGAQGIVREIGSLAHGVDSDHYISVVLDNPENPNASFALASEFKQTD